jgi:DNA-binding CsgD family transcriptional regulator
MPTLGTKTVASLGVLTRREHQVVSLVCEGHSNKVVAAALGISEGSVKQHLNRIYGKFGGRKRSELIKAFAHVEDRSHAYTKSLKS